MPARAGFDLIVEVLIGGTWYSVPGQRSTGGKINNEQVDVTEKGSVPWRSLAPCGVRINELTASGVTCDDLGTSLFNYMMGRAFDGAPFQARIRSNGSDVWALAMFIMVTMERSGEYNGAELYTISMSRSSEIPSVSSFTVYSVPFTVYGLTVTVYGA